MGVYVYLSIPYPPPPASPTPMQFRLGDKNKLPLDPLLTLLTNK